MGPCVLVGDLSPNKHVRVKGAEGTCEEAGRALPLFLLGDMVSWSPG